MAPRLFPSSPAAFRAWLERHHATETELQLGYWKKATGKPSLTWSESVDEAICFGWIDGVRRSFDADRYTVRFTPRRAGSPWSAVNRKKARALIAAGRMRPAGLAAWKARPAEEDPGYSFESRSEQALPPALARRFRAEKRAWAFFQGQPPGYRRTSIHWVASARREETRERRFRVLLDCSAKGKRIPLLAR